jgi:hypothetical protein
MYRLALLAALLLFSPALPAIAGDIGSPGGTITIRHPYAEMEWNVVKQFNFAHHVHARGKPYEAVMDMYSKGGKDTYHALQLDDRLNSKLPVWPWQDHQRNPEELRLYNVPGSESFGHVNHFVWLWSFYQHDASVSYHEAFQRSEEHALVYLAHPNEGKAADPRFRHKALTFDWIKEYFAAYTKLRGLAVLNWFKGAYTAHDIELWHALLLHFGPERPVYGYAEPDASDPSDPSSFDERYDRVLAKSLPTVHPDTKGVSAEHDTEFKRAWGNGRTFWINTRGRGTPPRVTNITVDNGVIRIAVDGDYDAIKWKYGMETIASGTKFDFGSVNASRYEYVRFEIWAGDVDDATRANIVGSQPFYRVRKK